MHEKHNGSDSNFLGGQIGGLWGAVPLKIEKHPTLVKFGSNPKFQGFVYQPSSISCLVFGESRNSIKGGMGGGSPTPKIQLHSNISDFGEIWTIYVDLHEKYNGSDPNFIGCLLYTSPSPRDGLLSRMPSSA